jgi:ATP-binding cassette, subfamily C (CFTR/MRP), member 1
LHACTAGALITFLAILIVISVATKYFAIALVPITIVYIAIQRYYIPTAREVQRIESISRSPIYSRFGEVGDGEGETYAHVLSMLLMRC